MLQIPMAEMPTLAQKAGIVATNEKTQNSPQAQPQVDMTEKPDTFERRDKIAKAVTISALVIGAVVGGFALAKNGTFGKKLQNNAEKLWNNIKSVFTKSGTKTTATNAANGTQASNVKNEAAKGVKKFFANGKEIEGVKLEKGKALFENGSTFTGDMETVIKKHGKLQTAKITYKDGVITQSTIDGKLYKTFESIDGFDRSKATLIKQYSTYDGQKVRELQHFYDDKGKVSKSVRRALKNFDNPRVKEFADKRLLADYKINQYNGETLNIEGSIFNADGTVNEFKYMDGTNNITSTLTKKGEDGLVRNIKTVEGKMEPNTRADELLGKKQITDISKITTYNGSPSSLTDRIYEIDYNGLTISNHGDNIAISGSSADKPWGELAFRRSYGSEIPDQFKASLRNGQVTSVLKDEFGGIGRHNLKDTIDEIEKGLKIAKETGANVPNADVLQSGLDTIKKNWRYAQH